MEKVTSGSVLEDSFAAPEGGRGFPALELPAGIFEEAPSQLSDDALEDARPRVRRRYWVVALVCVVLAALVLTGWALMTESAPASYGTAEVSRGDLATTISATGKVQAVTTVEVGTQISGVISGKHADFNDRVGAGDVIARIDSAQLEAQYNQANANYQSALARVETARSSVANADAAVQAAQANVDRAQAVLTEAQRNFDLTAEMVEKGVTARQQLPPVEATLAQVAAQKEQAVAQWNQAKAQAQSARSQLDQAQAEALQAEASTQVAKVNLDRTVIRAPIDGVVISRNVDVGQTVAASLSAPTLFLIANDLTRMQVLADIDEADIGQLEAGSKVTFTVDAFPADTFEGRIAEIRLAPQTVQNVVTYTTVVDVSNPDLKLKPGMTANVTVTVAERLGVLTVPNNALRFSPEDVDMAALRRNNASRPERPENASAAGPRQANGAVVWKVEDEGLSPARVSLGLTDGIATEVLGGAVVEGDQLAVPASSQTQVSTAPRGSMFSMGGPGGGRP